MALSFIFLLSKVGVCFAELENIDLWLFRILFRLFDTLIWTLFTIWRDSIINLFMFLFCWTDALLFNMATLKVIVYTHNFHTFHHQTNFAFSVKFEICWELWESATIFDFHIQGVKLW